MGLLFAPRDEGFLNLSDKNKGSFISRKDFAGKIRILIKSFCRGVTLG